MVTTGCALPFSLLVCIIAALVPNVNLACLIVRSHVYMYYYICTDMQEKEKARWRELAPAAGQREQGGAT